MRKVYSQIESKSVKQSRRLWTLVVQVCQIGQKKDHALCDLNPSQFIGLDLTVESKWASQNKTIVGPMYNLDGLTEKRRGKMNDRTSCFQLLGGYDWERWNPLQVVFFLYPILLMTELGHGSLGSLPALAQSGEVKLRRLRLRFNVSPWKFEGWRTSLLWNTCFFL